MDNQAQHLLLYSNDFTVIKTIKISPLYDFSNHCPIGFCIERKLSKHLNKTESPAPEVRIQWEIYVRIY